jgi:hypothetical protein
MINSAILYHFMGNPTRAASILYQALDLIDPTREPRLLLFALHNLADHLIQAARFMTAQRVLLHAHRLYRRFPEPHIQSLRQLLEAKVAYGLGHPEAETLLQAAVVGFISRNKLYDMNIISCDLAALRASRGNLSEG